MAAALVFRLHDRGPELVREVLLERGWEEYDEAHQAEEDWNLYWKGSAFRSSEYHNLLPWQRLNHYPKTVGITRKDCLARNLRRMRATFGSALYDFSPTAFILPNDFTRFLARFNSRRLAGEPSLYWICKPVDLSRGRGIFLFEDIKDLVYDCPVIVQQYISDPLLISGYKFDLRIYACVKSFHPLTIYVHQEGLVRFSTEKYDLSSLRNLFAHLTNTSINKLGPFYRTRKGRVGRGCKWTMSKFRHFLHSQETNELLLWQRINNIVTLTLLAIASAIPLCPNCVELLGFDVLIDATFKPWLLEVNYSPALTLDCQEDVAVKKGLIRDLIDLMNYKSVDGLRDRAYQRQGDKLLCFHPGRSKKTLIPPLSDFKPQNFKKKRHCQSQSETTHQLPPVDLYKTHAGRRINTKPHTDENLILSPLSRTNASSVKRRSCPMGNRSHHVSEVTNHDGKVTETETSVKRNVSSWKPENPLRGLRFGGLVSSYRLPNIHSGSFRTGKVPSDGATALNGQHIPPLRVGNFIRTFPFNKATLKASGNTLDVKMIIQELHKLTTRLSLGKSAGKKLMVKEEVVKVTDGEFDSLFWGPTDPPLLSQCLK